MDFLDILNGLGSGYNDAVLANQKQATGYNALQRDNLATARTQDQYNADDDYDIFNATSASNRSKLDLSEGTSDLALMGVQDKMDQFDPNTRAKIGELAQEFGGDTPEFRQALADYQAARGRLTDAEPQYAKFNQEVQARQQVMAQMQAMPVFEGVQVDSITKDEDGRLIALVGEPDENGEYAVMDLPPSLTTMYAALTGNMKPLGYNLKNQQALLAERAANAGQFPGTKPNIPKAPAQRTQAQTDLNDRSIERNKLQQTKMEAQQMSKIMTERTRLITMFTKQNMGTLEEVTRMVDAQLLATPGVKELLRKQGVLSAGVPARSTGSPTRRMVPLDAATGVVPARTNTPAIEPVPELNMSGLIDGQ